MDTSLLSIILPEGLLEFFSVTSLTELCDIKSKLLFYEIVLEENNQIYLDVISSEYESKGFPKVRLQDFPIRGRAVFLTIRRRRWRHKKDANKIIRNDFSFVAEGSGFTKELADFLKDTG